MTWIDTAYRGVSCPTRPPHIPGRTPPGRVQRSSLRPPHNCRSRGGGRRVKDRCNRPRKRLRPRHDGLGMDDPWQGGRPPSSLEIRAERSNRRPSAFQVRHGVPGLPERPRLSVCRRVPSGCLSSASGGADRISGAVRPVRVFRRVRLGLRQSKKHGIMILIGGHIRDSNATCRLHDVGPRDLMLCL